MELRVEQICGLYHQDTDMEHFKHFYRLMKLFESALDLEGEAALEIGVRHGGTSAAMAHIAQQKKKDYTILACDPWGSKPYDAGTMSLMGGGIEYSDWEYAKAKKLLAQFENHILFKQCSSPFLTYTLPAFHWWIGGKEFPEQEPFLNFVFIDGMHDDESVMSDYHKIFPFLMPKSIVVLDNISYAPRAHELLKTQLSGPESSLEHWEEENKLIWRRNIGKIASAV